MGLRALAAALLVCIAAALPGTAAQLTDQPLLLPGRPSRQGAQAGTAAARGPDPVERYGYFSPRGSPERRLFYWFYQVTLLHRAALPSTGGPCRGSQAVSNAPPAGTQRNDWRRRQCHHNAAHSLVQRGARLQQPVGHVLR
jgi:hypothetical protein